MTTEIAFVRFEHGEKVTTEIAFVRFGHREKMTTEIAFVRFEHRKKVSTETKRILTWCSNDLKLVKRIYRKTSNIK